jgi:hypothetical protein
MTEAGWYGEPGNASLERYWDGTQWTPQTRVPGDPGRTDNHVGPDLATPLGDDAPSADEKPEYEAYTSKGLTEESLCIRKNCTERCPPMSLWCPPHQAEFFRTKSPEQIHRWEEARQNLIESQAALAIASADRARAEAHLATVRENAARNMTPAARKAAKKKIEEEAAAARRQAGDAQKICPHCQVKGQVLSYPVEIKRGISGGKATGAILTGGISLLGTGLSRKESRTQMGCGNCKTTWLV